MIRALFTRRPCVLRPLFILAILVGLTACEGSGERLWLNAPDWSRARLVGLTEKREPVAMTTADGRTYLAIVQDQRPLVWALDETTALVWSQTAADLEGDPTALQLVWDEAQQQLFLLWMIDQDVYLRPLTYDGKWLADEARQLNGEIAVAQYVAAANDQGHLYILLGGNRRERGIYELTVTNGQATEPQLLAADGISPAVYSDPAGMSHMVWFEPPLEPLGMTKLQYTTAASTPITLVELDIRNDSDVYGPWLAQEHDNLYVLWSEEVLSGRASSTVRTQYVVVSTDTAAAPAEVQTVDFVNPRTPELLYEPFEGAGFSTSNRVLWQPPAVHGSRLYNINVASLNGPEIALVYRMPQTKDRRETSQVMVLYLANGRLTSSQLLSDTFYNSFDPQITADEEQNLWVNWIERVDNNQYAVYVASTHPAAREALAGLTADDVRRLSVDTVAGLLFNAVLTPFAFLVWMIVPALLLLVTLPFWREQEEAIHGRGWWSLGLAMAAYWGVKLFTMRAAWGYVPFSQWVPVVPTWLEVLLQIVMPLLITVAAALIAWRVSKRSDFQRVPSFFVVYALIDTLGVMMIYGEVLYNAL